MQMQFVDDTKGARNPIYVCREENRRHNTMIEVHNYS
jgi:hypothetical protein